MCPEVVKSSSELNIRLNLGKPCLRLPLNRFSKNKNGNILCHVDHIVIRQSTQTDEDKETLFQFRFPVPVPTRLFIYLSSENS